MYTDKFLRLPTKTIDDSLADLTGNTEEERCDIMVLPSEIAQYYGTETHDEEPITEIIFKSGYELAIYMHISEFESELNSHTD